MSEQEGNSRIYPILLKGQTSPDCIIKDWIDSYKVNKEEALIDLLQLCFDSSGCNGKVTEVSEDYTLLIRNLTKEFLEDTSDYPICRAGVKWKRFRSELSDFLSHLIRICQNSIIYDGYMLTHLTSLLSALSDSQVRAFRHTSTFAALKLVTGLIDVLASLSVKYSTSKRQYKFETGKSPERRINERIEHLFSLMKEFEENIDCLNELISFLFKAVFINRYRDVTPAIRELCISEMGLWMRKFPEKFVNDLHLKYIGWSLYDKISGVRIKALLALIPLYQNSKSVSHLEFFTLKFKDRIVSMTKDIDATVAVETFKLIEVMFYNFDYAFTEDDINEISKLIYCSVGEIAHQAGNFFCNRMESKIKNLDFPEQTIPKQINLNAIFFKYLLEFHMELNLHEHVSYLVDSLIENSVAMKDWKCMTNLLLGLDKEVGPLKPEEEKLLLEIMVCTVSQTFTRTPPIGRQEKKIQTLKLLKQSKDDIQKIGMHFTIVLPSLLDKFGTDSDNLSSILEISQYLDFSILAFYPSFIDSLENLISRLPTIVKISHDEEVLKKCCTILEIMSSNNYRTSLKTETCKNMIIDDIVNNFKLLICEWSEGAHEIDDDLKFSLTYSLLKISVFYSVFDLGNWSLWDHLFNFLNEVIEARIPIPEQCVKNCLVACYFVIFWDLKNCEENHPNNGESSGDLKLKMRILPYMDLLKRFIAHSSSTCSEESCTIFCDLLLILKNSFQALGFAPLPVGNTQKILQTFIEKRVFSNKQFVEIERSAEDLYKRRIMLASYCKLFVFGVLPVFFVSYILKHYVQLYSDFGDIFKTTLLGARTVDYVDCTRAILNALIMCFEESKHEIILENNMYVLKNLNDIKELGKQLSQFVITNQQKSTKENIAIYTLHREGISFALKDTARDKDGQLVVSFYILFFEVLIEFSHKLSQPIKLTILNFLNSKFSPENVLKCYKLQPLVLYRNTLSPTKNS